MSHDNETTARCDGLLHDEAAIDEAMDYTPKFLHPIEHERLGALRINGTHHAELEDYLVPEAIYSWADDAAWLLRQEHAAVHSFMESIGDQKKMGAWRTEHPEHELAYEAEIHSGDTLELKVLASAYWNLALNRYLKQIGQARAKVSRADDVVAAMHLWATNQYALYRAMRRDRQGSVASQLGIFARKLGFFPDDFNGEWTAKDELRVCDEM